MKKLFYFSLGTVLAFPLYAGQALGLSMNDFKDWVYKPSNLPGGSTADASTQTKINGILQFGTNILFYAAGSISVLLIVYGGITYITAFGNEEKMDSAKNLILYSLGGLVLMILGYALVTTVIGLIYRATL